MPQSVWPDWAIYWTLGNFSKPLATVNLPKSPTFLGNFWKGVKIFYFSSEIILGNFFIIFGDFFCFSSFFTLKFLTYLLVGWIQGGQPYGDISIGNVSEYSLVQANVVGSKVTLSKFTVQKTALKPRRFLTTKLWTLRLRSKKNFDHHSEFHRYSNFCKLSFKGKFSKTLSWSLHRSVLALPKGLICRTKSCYFSGLFFSK